MDIPAYLHRIGFTSSPQPDLPTLRRLQYRHLLAVPFENLSIHYGEPIHLDEEKLFEKIVERRRGGFCYELNGLFFALLRRLGYDARLISARVRTEEGDFGPEFDHMAIIVNLAEAGWLVDVGFGAFAREPLRLAVGQDQRDRDRTYRITRHSPTHFRVGHSERGMPMVDDYLFSLLAQDLEDFEEMCRFHSSSPESHFTRRKICSLTTADGRISLTEEKLIITSTGKREEQPVGGEEEFREHLDRQFGITLG